MDAKVINTWEVFDALHQKIADMDDMTLGMLLEDIFKVRVHTVIINDVPEFHLWAAEGYTGYFGELPCAAEETRGAPVKVKDNG
jgi:hypothetical protein